MEDDWSSQVHHNFSIVHLVIHNTIICDDGKHRKQDQGPSQL